MLPRDPDVAPTFRASADSDSDPFDTIGGNVITTRQQRKLVRRRSRGHPDTNQDGKGRLALRCAWIAPENTRCERLEVLDARFIQAFARGPKFSCTAHLPFKVGI